MATYQNLITQSMYDKQLDSGKGTLLHLCDDVIQQEVGPHSTLSAFLRTNKINTPSVPIYNLFDFFYSKFDHLISLKKFITITIFNVISFSI
jgi:hypothetical protein